MAGLDLSKLFDPNYNISNPSDLPLASDTTLMEASQNRSAILESDTTMISQTSERPRISLVDYSSDEEDEEDTLCAETSKGNLECDVFSPVKVPVNVASTSTPLREKELVGNITHPFNCSTSTIPGVRSPDNEITLSQISHVSNTPTNTKQRASHPIGWSMPKRRRLEDTASTFVLQPVPNYHTTITRSQTNSIITPHNPPPQVTNRDVQALSFVMGTSDDLPPLDDNSDNEENSEEDEKIANQLKEMLDNGDIASWEHIMDSMAYTRHLYAKVDDAAYMQDRSRMLKRLKQTYESLNRRPAPTVLMNTPAKMTKELKPHQQSGLKFMLWRESEDPSGGILADDMGLGKTMSIVALVTATIHKDPWINDMRFPHGVRYYGQTIIICPPSLTCQWAEEFTSSSNGVRVLVHHGETRAKNVEELMRYHVVITSYNMVMNELRMANKFFYKVLWKRIVLDEGHLIRNYKAQQSEAVSKLHGKYKWILTGTPIHNRIDDVYPYLIFLNCHPLDERTIFMKWTKSNQGQCRLNVILKALMLRRTKEQLNTVPGEKVIRNYEYDLVEKEDVCYKRLMALSQSMMKVYLNNRARDRGDAPLYQGKDVYKMHKIMQKRMHGYITTSHIFVLLLRLRQFCCHPTLITPMLQRANEATHIRSEEETEEEFGEEEQNEMAQILNDALDEKEIFTTQNEIFDENRCSSKIQMLLYVMQEHFINTKDKALIVCEWPSFLNVIADHLSTLSLSYEFYTGEVPMKERPEVIKRFNSPCMFPRILLLSLTCGGIGLNLAKANHIFLVTTHWNPQLELQAEDRCYRIGQERDVNIYKFRALGTIEESIYKLQQHKLQVADKLLTGATGNNYRLTINDLKTLFGI